MKRLVGLTVLALAVAALPRSARGDDKDKIPEIADIMEAHSKTGARAKVAAAVKAKKWEDAAEPMKEWLKLAEALGKNKPPKGTEVSWKKLTGTYEKTVKTLATAVEKKNAQSANGALGKIGGMCGTCHKAHRP